jgi:hypothetical protein
MSITNHFENFITLDNFYLSFARLQTASKDLYKELYYEDLKIFEIFLRENIECVIDEIKEEIFKPESSYKIFIPKKNNLIRPLSLLKFKDLLVYQAVINTIVDAVYDDISPYYNNIIFGNVCTTSKDNEKDRIFFFKPWRHQWKKFENKTKEYYESGYNFLSEFDIASFFDSIDHHILRQILEEKYKIDDKLLDILINLLEKSTSDSDYKNFTKKHGIPQGPIGSSFLGDLYLFHLDVEIKKRNIDIKYIRYCDDIRIFAKDKFIAQKAISELDLLARDLGLIPQANKILVSQINDVNSLLKDSKNKFSAISKEYKKKEGKLKAKTHKSLKKRFLDCFIKNSSENYLDKTLIRFSLYRLNEDEEIKSTLLQEWDNIYLLFEAILFYLEKHFAEDVEVKNWLINILKNENILFPHIIALVFKFFPGLPFMEDVYIKYMYLEHRYWLIKYFMIHWLFNNKKFELIQSFNSNNYFLNREIINFKFRISNDPTYLKFFIKNLLENSDALVALHGFSLLMLPSQSEKLFSLYNLYFSICYPELSNDEFNAFDTNKHHGLIKYIASKERPDYIRSILKDEFSILNINLFFSEKVWPDRNIYQELKLSLRLSVRYRSIDASKSLLNLNIFNNLIYDKLCEVINIHKVSKEYGGNLKSNCLDDLFPITNTYFTKINDQRNQRTDAHPYDKQGNPRIRISIDELDDLFEKEKKALEEICSFNFSDYIHD